MIEALYTIAGIMGYIIGGAFTFGVVAHKLGDKDDPWDTPLPLMSTWIWPPVLALVLLYPTLKYGINAGINFSEWQKSLSYNRLIKIETKKLEQKRIRIEAEKANQELNEIINQVDEEINDKLMTIS